MRILCTGGCGYVGSVLVPKLLAAGHFVHVADLQWFGNHLQIPVPVFDFRGHSLEGYDTIIHLAGVANDPCGELNPVLSWEINALGTAQLADAAARAGVKQFIYASSGSVYGVKGDKAVTEDEPLVPISEYNKTKMVAERVLLSYADRMAVQIVRPGTVCGWSPRQRLDISVNGLTMQALTTGLVKVGGFDLCRANIHIEDMAAVYMFMLEHPELTGVYNAAFENASLGGIALAIQARIPCKVKQVEITDPRSYLIDSSKILAAGFKPKHTIGDAIETLMIKFGEGQLKDTDNCYNLRMMPK